MSPHHISISIYVPLIALGLRLFSTSTATLSFVVLAVYALRNRSSAIHSLFLSWFFSMLNPEFAPELTSSGIGRYLVIFAAMITVLIRRKSKFSTNIPKTLLYFTFGLSALIFLHSLFFSEFVEVSVLKSISWILVIFILLSAWGGLTEEEQCLLFNSLKFWLLYIVVFSLPFLAIPNIGFSVNGTGFQGLLNHPQAFGLTVSLLCVIVGGQILTTKEPSWIQIGIFFLGLGAILLSEARTAAFALVISLIGASLISSVFQLKSWRIRLIGVKSRKLKLILLVMVACFPLLPSSVTELGSDFVLKRSDEAGFLNVAEASRGVLVYPMLENINTKLFSGIGFGVGSIPDFMVVERDSFFGLPLSAPVEKGVMPLAVLEELGLFVAILVFSWLFYVLKLGFNGGIIKFATIILILILNLGESMLFSTGGMGMLLLIFLTASVMRRYPKCKVE